MKKIFRRTVAAASATALCAATLFAFAGCTTKHPEVTITYTFNGTDYEVDYILSRYDAPQTVQHFIELADAGYYDGMCIHDYDTNFLYSGGYTLEDGELVEVDYFSRVKQLEEEKGITFTQSVWTDDEAHTPLYTVRGEFTENSVHPQYSRENNHSTGALVMYYTSKGSYEGDVVVRRADEGKDNEGKAEQEERYKYNSATSLFYTYTSPSANTDLQKTYCVFGMAKDFTKQLDEGLLQAIRDYISERADDENYAFAPERTEKINTFEPFEEVRKGGLTAVYETPVEQPIIIKSVKVTKY